jgi:hypothetical protein
MRPVTHTLVIALLLGMGCQEKFDLATLPSPVLITADTSYVAFEPPFVSSPGAEDVMIGKDQLLYVAETADNRLVMMNRGGQVLSQRTMLRPESITQDTRLDLLVGGCVVTQSGDTAGALFRLHLVSSSADSAHRLDLAPIETLWVERAHPERRFPGIATFGDNSYLAVRDGADNTSIVDPDSRILVFDARDRFITPLPGINTRPGSGITDMYRPTSIATFTSGKDFVLGQNAADVAYGALWFIYQKTSDFDGWLPKFDPAHPEDQGVDFIRPGRYVAPEAVAIDRSRSDIFIADAGLDSIFKFNSRGSYRKESFGFYRSRGVLQRPTGLAFFEQVLYVLDGATGLIHRFRLSTDITR